MLLRYKRAHGWAPVLARLLIGWLDDRLLEVGGTEWDLVTAVPHADGEQGRAYSPGQLILRLARDEDSFYPFDASPPPVIVKTSPTPMMTPLGAQDRAQVAQGPLHEALLVTNPGRVRGGRVLVIDDHFTTGASSNAVARRLLESGASVVDVFVFARSVISWAR